MRKKLHRTLLVLLLVLTPPYFLIFTEEGQRIADNTLLWLIGGDSIEFNIRELNSEFSRADVLKVFPDQDWQCAEQKTPFGTELCAAEISAYNDYPAHYLTMFFANGKVSAMKMVYRKNYHQQLQAHLIEQLGAPINNANPQVVEWNAPGGKVVMPQVLEANTETAFLWLGN